jgi:DNA-binding transcriptional LysR family regulator
MQVNWNQVYYFSIVASCGSLKQASNILGLSSPTLSEHISQLEEDLKIRLFKREHRQLQLTDEGSKLYLRAREMFEAGERLLEDVSPLPIGSHPLAIGLVPCPSIQVAYRILGDFLEKFGPFNMKIFRSDYTDLEESIAGASFDYGFSNRLPRNKDLDSRLVSSSRIKFYVSSKAKTGSFSSLLERLPLLICNADPATRTYVEDALANEGIHPSNTIIADYPSMLMDLCKRGLGIGVFTETPFAEDFVKLEALRVPPDAPKISEDLYVIWSKTGNQREVIKKLMGILEETPNK